MADAIGIMVNQKSTAVVIMGGDRVQGIVSRGDVLRWLKKHSTECKGKDISVKQVMKTKVIVAGPEQLLQEAIGHMDAADIAHLPVVQEGNVLSVLRREDLLQRQVQLLLEQIDDLQLYIDNLHNAELD
jgi:CBS domain-containing protein